MSETIDMQVEYSVQPAAKELLNLYKKGLRVRVKDLGSLYLDGLPGTITVEPDPYAVWLKLDSWHYDLWFFPEELEIL